MEAVDIVTARMKPEPEPTLEEVEQRLAGLLADVETETDDEKRVELQNQIDVLDETVTRLHVAAQRAARNAQLVAAERARRERQTRIDAQEAQRAELYQQYVTASDRRGELHPRIDAAADALCALIEEYGGVAEQQAVSARRLFDMPVTGLRDLSGLARFMEFRFFHAFPRGVSGRFSANIAEFGGGGNGQRSFAEAGEWTTHVLPYSVGPLLADLQAEQAVIEQYGSLPCDTEEATQTEAGAERDAYPIDEHRDLHVIDDRSYAVESDDGPEVAA